MKYKNNKKNKERAERIVATIEAYGNGDDTDDITDIITDLRHYAQQNKLDFAAMLARSESHFEAEGAGE